jgi:uncharacterized membrane protein YidH (DUF202 family)
MSQPVLAAERSSLAWTRTGLSALGLGLLLIKLAASKHQPVEYGAAGLVMFAGLLSSLRANVRSSGKSEPFLGSVRLVAAATAGAGLLTLISMVG